MKRNNTILGWCLVILLFISGFFVRPEVAPKLKPILVLNIVNLRLATNHPIIMDNGSNISEHLRDVIFQQCSIYTSTYRLRFRTKQVPELPNLLKSLEESRTKVSLTLNSQGKNLNLSGYTFTSGSYVIFNQKGYYDAFISKENEHAQDL